MLVSKLGPLIATLGNQTFVLHGTSHAGCTVIAGRRIRCDYSTPQDRPSSDGSHEFTCCKGRMCDVKFPRLPHVFGVWSSAVVFGYFWFDYIVCRLLVAFVLIMSERPPVLSLRGPRTIPVLYQMLRRAHAP